jgi:hypothetical protein
MSGPHRGEILARSFAKIKNEQEACDINKVDSTNSAMELPFITERNKRALIDAQEDEEKIEPRPNALTNEEEQRLRHITEQILEALEEQGPATI